MAVNVGVRAADTEAASVQRLMLIPVILGLASLILSQEGLLEIALFPDDVQRATNLFPGLIAPEYVFYTFMAVLGILIWRSVRVVQRTMRRIRFTGLDQ